MLRIQHVELLAEFRFTSLRRGYVSQTDEQLDGAVVARGLFRRDERSDLFPHSRLSCC